jgi:hypothetical protein
MSIYDGDILARRMEVLERRIAALEALHTEPADSQECEPSLVKRIATQAAIAEVASVSARHSELYDEANTLMKLSRSLYAIRDDAIAARAPKEE